MLMGAGIQRKYRELNDDGLTHWNIDVPTLSIAGTKDGLYRITRVAEGWWHQYENIEQDQAGLFPIASIEGTSHMSYMTGEAPAAVKKKDLRPAVKEDDAHKLIAAEMVKFLENRMDGKTFNSIDSDAILAPIVDAMKLEGFYNLKEPCYF